MIGDALDRRFVQLNHGARIPWRQVFYGLAIFDGRFDEKSVQLKAANEPFEIAVGHLTTWPEMPICRVRA